MTFLATPGLCTLQAALVAIGLVTQVPPNPKPAPAKKAAAPAAEVPVDDAAGDTAAPTLPYPETETVTPGAADIDAEKLLTEAVAKMGGARLDKLVTLSFSRESWHWRGPRLGFWEKAHTQARLEGGLIGRVDFPSEIDPNNGRPLNTVFVENGDDKFMMMNKSVLATEMHETMASMVLRNEVFAMLAPWLVLRSHVDVVYEGRARFETFKPDYDPETGFANYQPVTREYDKIVAEVPQAFVQACGKIIEFYIDPETRVIDRFRCRFDGREGTYGGVKVMAEIAERQTVDGVELPARLLMRVGLNAEVREYMELLDIKFDPGLDEAILKRP